MGLEAITRASDGGEIIPSKRSDWDEWVSATDTRNYALQDPLLDWLDLYGHANGFQRDDEISGYDARTDFANFLFKKAKEFESAVLSHIKGLTSVTTISSSPEEARDVNKARETLAAMTTGVPVIYQAVLWDAQNRTYGVPDLLVRSDELLRLFPGTLIEVDAAFPASDIRGAKWHYRVVDIKFTTLHLLVEGELGSSGSAPAYKTALSIYTSALGRLQGYEPAFSYLLGRGWEQKIKDKSYRGESCMEKLPPVAQNSHLKKGIPLVATAQEACEWVRRVRREGAKWAVLPNPSIPELRPNMGTTEDAPWGNAKGQIAERQEELTLLWQVGLEKRREANKLGLYRWRDPRCTAAALGVTGPKTQPVLQAILDINRSDKGSPVAPPRVTAAEDTWRPEATLEFYIDFETVNDLNDDFSKIPKRGGLPMIFMIGCGYVEKGNWQFKCFTTNALTEADEADVIEAWLTHMGAVRTQLGLTNFEPLLIHWSGAETSNFEGAYNAAVKRHPKRSNYWPSLRWFDLWKKVFREEPVVVRGALGFGLKEVAQAMNAHGFIHTKWEEGPVDGLGAMVGAWWCAEQATGKKASLSTIDLMKDIQRYNEVDCKVMMEILRYLRAKH